MDQEHDLIGRALGPVVIEELLAHDDLIEIYRGVDEERDLPVTVLVAGRFLENDPVFNAQFRADARALAGLRHPNIASVHDFGAAEGGHYIIMDYVEGPTLADVMVQAQAGERDLQSDDITFITRQIAAALDYTHRNGIVHGAVTPGSIIITRSGQAVLTNFGLSLLYLRAGITDLDTTLLGTDEYLSPEQLEDARAAMPASDIYSLGVVLYEIATGERPYLSGSDVDDALRNISDSAPDPRLLNPDLPESVAVVILQALSSAPRDRFRTAMRLATMLEKAYQNPDWKPRASRKERAQPGRVQAPQSPGDYDEQVVQRRPTAERITVPQSARGADARRSKRRLRAEAQRVSEANERAQREREKLQKQLQAQQKRLEKQQALAQRKQRRGGGCLRTMLIGLVLLLVVGAGAAALHFAGIVSIQFTMPGSEPTVVVEATATVTVTPSPTTTPTPTITPSPTPTPIPLIEATPVPPIAVQELEVGTTAFRLHDGAPLSYVPAGTFLMGTDISGRAASTRPQHVVQLSAFWIDQYEVTNGQYAGCVSAGSCEEPTRVTRFEDSEYQLHPVTYVSYDAAAKYCLWLAAESGQVIGLPTEAQWEKAASWDPVNEVARQYPWGDEDGDLTKLHSFQNSQGGTAEVGSYPLGASAYEIYDMAGNVWEWVADWFDADYYKRTGLATDPTGPLTGTYRITRGGSWTRSPYLAVNTARNGIPPTSASEEIGFRCALRAERPSAQGGIYLTPLELAGGLVQLMVDAGNDAASDATTVQNWQAALQNLEQALQAGDNSTALLIVNDQVTLLALDAETGLLDPALAYRLDRSLEWLRARLLASPATVG